MDVEMAARTVAPVNPPLLARRVQRAADEQRSGQCAGKERFVYLPFHDFLLMCGLKSG